jgi:hypothetical protein
MKNDVIWDVTLYGSCNNRRFGGTYRLQCQGEVSDRGVLQLVGTVNIFSSKLILITLMMEAIRSSKTSVPTRSTRCHIPEDGILHSHRRKNLESYIALTGWTLYRRSDVSPVRYELGFYIPEDGILQIHRNGNFKSYIALTGRAL